MGHWRLPNIHSWIGPFKIGEGQREGGREERRAGGRERERETEKEGESERERKRERDGVGRSEKSDVIETALADLVRFCWIVFYPFWILQTGYQCLHSSGLLRIIGNRLTHIHQNKGLTPSIWPCTL